jgi:hypothetical protein
MSKDSATVNFYFDTFQAAFLLLQTKYSEFCKPSILCCKFAVLLHLCSKVGRFLVLTFTSSVSSPSLDRKPAGPTS